MSTRFVESLTFCVVIALAGCSSSPPVERAANGVGVVEVDRKSEALFEQALTAIQGQRYTEAESLLKELTARDPLLSGPWVNLGGVYEALGDNDAAQNAYKKAIDANPNNCAAYVDLGVLSRRAGDFLTAEANYLACTQRVPNFREAYLNLGILYELYLGRLDDALKAYQTYQTLSENPDMRVAGWVSDLERRIAGNES
ncbi:MAG TPA: tetratricopeptide repeat protein [Pseudomonadales bacterium]|nr:tetratricopeptide repeat protein [Pseudomonadales bacterium]